MTMAKDDGDDGLDVFDKALIGSGGAVGAVAGSLLGRRWFGKTASLRNMSRSAKEGLRFHQGRLKIAKTEQERESARGWIDHYRKEMAAARSATPRSAAYAAAGTLGGGAVGGIAGAAATQHGGNRLRRKK